MKYRRTANPYYTRSAYRLVSFVFGLFLTGVGIYAVFIDLVDPSLRTGAGLLITMLGANLAWSAVQSKISWLSKLGPLP